MNSSKDICACPLPEQFEGTYYLDAASDLIHVSFYGFSWMQHVDAEPGINLSMMQALIVKKNENPDHYTQYVVVFLYMDYIHVHTALCPF
jgi:hypothetical protein